MANYVATVTLLDEKNSEYPSILSKYSSDGFLDFIDWLTKAIEYYKACVKYDVYNGVSMLVDIEANYVKIIDLIKRDDGEVDVIEH